jgi:N-acetylneuraminic acid mutarotase
VNKEVVALSIMSALLISMLTAAQLIEVTSANPSTQWIKDIGSFSLGSRNSVIQTADGGYALTGGKDGGFLLLKTNSSGDVQWEKTYGTEAEFTSFANAIVQAEDGGYVIAGQGTPWPNFIGPNGTLFNLLKTDPMGNVQWNRSYSTEDTPLIATSLIKTSGGGYAVAGYAETGHTIMGYGTGYVCLIKTDEAGSIQWRKQFEADAIWAPFHISVVETKDAGYALLTVADFSIQAIPAVENVDFWLIKTDSDGDIQWSETYGGPHNDIPSAFVETSDGGYLLGGSTLRNHTADSVTYLQQDAWLVKADSEGNMLWNKTYGGEGADIVTSVLESQHGGYVIATTVDVSSENPPSGALIFKTDTSGNTEWTVEYQGATQPVLHPLQIIETEDDAYVFTGYRPRTDSTEALSIVLVKLTEPSTIPEDSWATKESMPTARYRFGIAVVDEKIYAIGGLTSDGTLSTNEAYDPATNTWETKNPMPTPRYYFAVAVYDNKIYTFGGLTDLPLQNNTYVGVTEVYDPATDSWETKTSMPTNRSALCASVVDGKIILTGGIVYGPPPSFSSNSEVTEVYDPETDTWTSKASIPTPVCSYTSAVINNKIYVIGGSKQDTTYSILNQVYDAETDTWTEAAPIPTGVRFAAVGVTTGALAPERIYVIGGSTAQFPDGSNLTQIYDPEKDGWTYGTSMPTPRSGLRAAVINDVLYAIGGFNTNGDNILAANEEYIPIGYIPEFPSWTPLLIMLIAVTAGAVIYSRNIYKHNQRRRNQ